MNLDKMIQEWELFEKILRHPDSDLFKEFLEAVREYRDAVESQKQKPSDLLLKTLALKNQELINELKKRHKIR